MKIININSEIELTAAQQSFVEEVLACGDRHCCRDKDSFYFLSKTIPIFLLNEKSMQKYDKNNDKEAYILEDNQELEFIKPHTEWLGFYGRTSGDVFVHTPRIVLCPERIEQCVANDEEFMFLIAKVIVHELAHAKMDSRDQNTKYWKKDLFWEWMEESSANRYTLDVFEDFTHRYCCRHNSYKNKQCLERLWDYVVNFIKQQPPHYALGYELFEKSPVIDWEWERKKEELGGTKRSKEKSEWLTYMQKHYRNLDSNAEQYFEAVFD